MIESQVNYILDAIQTTLQNKLLFTNVRAEVQHEFNQSIQEKMKKNRMGSRLYQLVSDCGWKKYQ